MVLIDFLSVSFSYVDKQGEIQSCICIDKWPGKKIKPK